MRDTQHFYQTNQAYSNVSGRNSERPQPFIQWLSGVAASPQRNIIVGLVLMVALLAFEVFNFDTTRYALNNFLGDVRFMGITWAAILAIAFCSIDFAGLVRVFTPETGRGEPKEVWYLMGAWLLGATLNAVMTWWAVSLTLLNHEFGNEILSREQLLQAVPVFVAVLVWLTRILFIGSLAVAGEHLLGQRDSRSAHAMAQAGQAPQRPLPAQPTVTAQPTRVGQQQPVVHTPVITDEVPPFLHDYPPTPRAEKPATQPSKRQPKRPVRPQPTQRPHVEQRVPFDNNLPVVPLGAKSRGKR